MAIDRFTANMRRQHNRYFNRDTIAHCANVAEKSQPQTWNFWRKSAISLEMSDLPPFDDAVAAIRDHLSLWVDKDQWTVAKWSIAAGGSKDTLRNFLNGDTYSPTLGFLWDLARVRGMTVTQLLSQKPADSQTPQRDESDLAPKATTALYRFLEDEDMKLTDDAKTHIVGVLLRAVGMLRRHQVPKALAIGSILVAKRSGHKDLESVCLSGRKPNTDEG